MEKKRKCQNLKRLRIRKITGKHLRSLGSVADVDYEKSLLRLVRRA